MTSAGHRAVCDAAQPDLLDGATFEVPQLAWAKTWTDVSGAAWRAKGDGLLEPTRARRLLERSDVRVLHVYDGYAHEHTGEDRDGLIVEVSRYWAGLADPMASFDIREFRSEELGVMVLIQEHC